jgi:hypothetical protein
MAESKVQVYFNGVLSSRIYNLDKLPSLQSIVEQLPSGKVFIDMREGIFVDITNVIIGNQSLEYYGMMYCVPWGYYHIELNSLKHNPLYTNTYSKDHVNNTNYLAALCLCYIDKDIARYPSINNDILAISALNVEIPDVKEYVKNIPQGTNEFILECNFYGYCNNNKKVICMTRNLPTLAFVSNKIKYKIEKMYMSLSVNNNFVLSYNITINPS